MPRPLNLLMLTHVSIQDDIEAALYAKDQVLPKVTALRGKLDALETITDRSSWALYDSSISPLLRPS